MQIKRSVLAVSLALAMPVAFAADSVTVYGHVAMGLEQVQAKGATQYDANSPYNTPINALLANGQKDIPSRTRVTDALSHLGIKGQEDLGDGMSAFFQIESAIKPDDGCGYVGCAFSDVSKPASGQATIGTRQSFVGLKGRFGTIQAGRLDMYFDKHVPNELHLLRSGNNSTALAVLGYAFNSGGAAAGFLPNTAALPTNPLGALSSFAVPFYNVGNRASNVVQYRTPNFKGLSALVAATAPESKGKYNLEDTGANGLAQIAGGLNRLTGGREVRPQATEVTVAYFPGWLFTSLAFMQEKDPVPLVAGGIIDKAYGVKFSLGANLSQAFRIGMVFERQVNKYNANFAQAVQNLSRLTGNPQIVSDASRETWVLSTSYKFSDAFDMFATYAKANDIKQWNGSTDNDSGAQYYQLTGFYNLSKRTNLFATVARVENEANAAYNFFINGSVGTDSGRQSPFVTTPRGSDPSSYQIGISHNF
ncbi:putative porin [Chitinivorax tropicus]|uniref:Putative porin n=1 Tax=Chitinivorax tropicus TaxID=714531 RepID=A0A840MPM8_9PROT|nr:porin [Chitinivorax tropicus]MBB5018436.1 putative porin [Chitinivorax tropicus]